MLLKLLHSMYMRFRMSLSVRKHKTKIGDDPQNLNWRNDDNQIGQRLMKKMGWSNGGLGKFGQGVLENIKQRANYSGEGLKAKVEVASEKDPWLTCHQEFSSILLQLNKDASSKHKIEKKKLLLKSKYSTRYSRIKKSKDASLYSQTEKSAIFGIGNVLEQSEQSKHEILPISINPPEIQSSEDDKKYTTSRLSVKDYFALKMRKRNLDNV